MDFVRRLIRLLKEERTIRMVTLCAAAAITVVFVVIMASVLIKRAKDNPEKPKTTTSTTVTSVSTDPPQSMTTSDEPPVTTAPPDVGFTVESLNESRDIYDGDRLLVKVSVSMPRIKANDVGVVLNPAAVDAINNIFAAQIDNALAYAETDLLDLAKIAVKNNSAAPIPFNLQINYTITCDTKQILSVLIHTRSTTDGAHPQESSAALSLITTTGEMLEIADILVEDFANAQKMLFDKLKDIASTTDTSLYYPEYQGMIAQNDLSNTWYLCEEGLEVIYNPYEIGPFTSGVLSFTVPYAELDGILRPEFLRDGSIND